MDRLAVAAIAADTRAGVAVHRVLVGGHDRAAGHKPPARLTQAFVNLLENASKYGERGGRVWVTAGQTGTRPS